MPNISVVFFQRWLEKRCLSPCRPQPTFPQLDHFFSLYALYGYNSRRLRLAVPRIEIQLLSLRLAFRVLPCTPTLLRHSRHSVLAMAHIYIDDISLLQALMPLVYRAFLSRLLFCLLTFALLLSIPSSVLTLTRFHISTSWDFWP